MSNLPTHAQRPIRLIKMWLDFHAARRRGRRTARTVRARSRRGRHPA